MTRNRPLTIKEGIKAFAIRIGNSEIHELDLESCKINSDLLCLLIDPLKTNEAPIRINLKDNDISNLGAGELFEALKENKTIEELDVSNNSSFLSYDGTSMDFLKENKTLKILRIANCGLPEERVSNLLGAIEANKTLEEIDISGCAMEPKNIRKLLKIIEEKPENFKLTYLGLDKINPTHQEQIYKLVEDGKIKTTREIPKPTCETRERKVTKTLTEQKSGSEWCAIL